METATQKYLKDRLERPCDRCSEYTESDTRICGDCTREDPNFETDEKYCSNCHLRSESVTEDLCYDCEKVLQNPKIAECLSCQRRYPVLYLDMRSGYCEKCKK